MYRRSRSVLFQPGQLAVRACVGAFALICLIPFIMLVSGSLSDQRDVLTNGYPIWPRKVNLLAYELLLRNGQRLLTGYKITTFVTIVGTFLSLLVNTMMAYTMARRNLRHRRFLSVFTLITMLFSGGLVPWFILCKNYLGLYDNIAALILPSLANAWNMYIIRNYFQSLPEELYESAKIDGAGDYVIFFRIMLFLAMPVLATIALFTALGFWNDWWLGLMLLEKPELQPLQLTLKSMVSNAQFIAYSPELQKRGVPIPSDAMKMATTVFTIGPIVFLYPFLQRYFIKGILIGSVKG